MGLNNIPMPILLNTDFENVMDSVPSKKWVLQGGSYSWQAVITLLNKNPFSYYS